MLKKIIIHLYIDEWPVPNPGLISKSESTEFAINFFGFSPRELKAKVPSVMWEGVVRRVPPAVFQDREDRVSTDQ